MESVRHGSLSAAAKTSHMSQPQLSAAGASLETELGVRLPPRTCWAKVVSWADLTAHPVFTPPVSSRFPGLGNLVLAELTQHAGRRPDIRTVSQHQAVPAQVLAGSGVAVTAQGSTDSNPGCPVSVRALSGRAAAHADASRPRPSAGTRPGPWTSNTTTGTLVPWSGPNRPVQTAVVWGRAPRATSSRVITIAMLSTSSKAARTNTWTAPASSGVAPPGACPRKHRATSPGPPCGSDPTRETRPRRSPAGR